MVEQVDLLLAEALPCLLSVIALLVDHVTHVLNLTALSIDSGVQLHGVFSSVLQVLLKVGDLARQLALR